MCLVMWPRYVLKATCVTSLRRLRWFPHPNTQLIISVIKNWKSAAGREPVGSDNNAPTRRPPWFRTDPVGSAQKLGFVGEGPCVQTNRRSFLLFCWGIQKAGNTKRPTAEKRRIWERAKRRGDPVLLLVPPADSSWIIWWVEPSWRPGFVCSCRRFPSPSPGVCGTLSTRVPSPVSQYWSPRSVEQVDPDPGVFAHETR